MAADITTLGFAVDTSGLSRGQRAMDSYSNTGRTTERSVNGSVSSMNNSFMGLYRSIGLVSAGLAAIGSIKITNAIASQTDTWLNLTSQIRQVTDSESELIEVREKLLGVTRDTRSELTNTVNLYAEMTRGTSELNISSDRLIGVTSTLNNLFTAGGKPISETIGAIRQLNQGFASGVLRGDEFNSVAEGAPKILDALSLSLGKTRGELREFAATGGITAQIMITAIEAYKDQAQSLADQTATTFGLYLQAAGTNVTEFTGKSETLTNAVLAVGKSIEYLSKKIAPLVSGLESAVAVIGVGLFLAITKSTVAMIGSVAANVSELNAVRATTVGQATLANQYARSASVMAESEAVKAQATASSLRFTISQLEAETALESQRLRAQISQTGRMQTAARMAEIQLSRLALTNQLTAAEARLSSAEAAVVTAQTAQTATTNAVTSATARASIGTIALTGATRALGAAVNFLMSGWGLLLVGVGFAISTFYSTSSAADDASDALERQKGKVDELRKGYSALTDETLVGMATSAKLELLAIGNQVDELTTKASSIKPSISMFGRPSGNDVKREDYTREIEAENKKYNEQSVVLETINKIIADRKAKEDDDNTKRITAENKSYNNQVLALKSLNEQIGLNSDQLFIYNQMQKATGYTKEQTAEIMLQAKAYIENKNAYESFQEAFGGQDMASDDLNLGLTTDTSYQDWIDEITSSTNIGQIQALKQEMINLYLAMDAGGLPKDIGKEAIDSLQDRIDGLKPVDADIFGSVADSAKAGLQSIQSMYAQGSKEYQKMGVAIQAVTALQAVQAVMTQGTGDPYTAIPRMAAMAATVASLGYSVGALTGGLGDDSAANQESQGLTFWGDKSESIANSIDMTADATDDLVGINTDMLSTLQTMASNITSASALVLRTGGNGEGLSSGTNTSSVWGGISSIGDKIGGIGGSAFDAVLGVVDAIFLGAFSNILGGSSSVSDSGVTIVGDSISDLINNTTVLAFEDIKYKKWKFGSTKTKTVTSNISGAVGSQFGLVFESILDSVATAALGLGVSDSDLNARISAFNVATTEISLKGLSSADQQAEIEAVFSSIFDSLASAVVPFASKFQNVGEGIGETLSRLSIQMSVAQLASDTLGFSFGGLGAEMNTFVSNELSGLMGGVSEFASSISSFIDSFATDEQKFTTNSDYLTESLNAIGVAVPNSTSGFYNLMNGIDAATASGREQIATILGLTDVASDYYDYLEDANSSFNSLTSSLRDMIISMYDLGTATDSISLDMALAAARNGDFTLAEEFGGISFDESDYSSLFDYQKAQAESANKIAELANLTEGQVSYDERQTNLLTEINEGIQAMKEETANLLKVQNKLQSDSQNSLDRIENIGIEVRT